MLCVYHFPVCNWQNPFCDCLGSLCEPDFRNFVAVCICDFQQFERFELVQDGSISISNHLIDHGACYEGKEAMKTGTAMTATAAFGTVAEK